MHDISTDVGEFRAGRPKWRTEYERETMNEFNGHLLYHINYILLPPGVKRFIPHLFLPGSTEILVEESTGATGAKIVNNYKNKSAPELYSERVLWLCVYVMYVLVRNY